MKTSRRTFVKGALALPAALSFSNKSYANEKYDVVIIGAGLSGLHAAVLLHDLGFKVKVLEGKSRVGGRVETGYGLKTRPELGASQIGRGYARVIASCNRFNLKLIPEDRDLLEFSSYLDDRWIKAENWPSSDLNPMTGDDRDIPPVGLGNALIERSNPLVNLDDWLSEKFSYLDITPYDLFKIKGYSDDVIHLAGQNVYANDIYSVSCLSIMQEQHRGRWSLEKFSSGNTVVPAPYGFKETSRDRTQELALISNIEEGAEALPKAMAGHLDEDAVSLNKIVMRIGMDASGASVETLDGSEYRADFVVSAIPFTTLRRIDIRPGLPETQNKAVHQLPYNNTSRAHLVIREPFWEEDGLDPSFFSDGAIRMFWAVDNHTGKGPYVGYMVLTGDAASRVDMMTPDAARKFLMQELERIRPASKGKVDIVTYKSWENDPLIRGVRHNFAPGQVTEFAEQMADPYLRLHFAGEHTRRTEIGMEAAMESGERVALEIAEKAG